ncbi:MAG: DNA repair protein RecO [Candidatus Omnitrophota bacterium]
MAAHKAEGIILKKYLLRETSYIIIAFTKEFGKIKGVIKGVRAPYPQFAGNFEIFTQCRLLFYKKKKNAMDLITQCEALDFFLPIRKDIERLTYANYFIELVNTVTTEYDINEELYRVLTESLKMLASKTSAKRAARIFELKLLNVLGFSPQMEECALCGYAGTGLNLFSIKNGGVLCKSCGKVSGGFMSLSNGTVNFIKKIQQNDFDKIAQIKVSKEVGMETETVLKKFLNYYINYPIKSLKFLEHIEKMKTKYTPFVS